MQRIILAILTVSLCGLVPTAGQSQVQQASKNAAPTADAYTALVAEYQAAQNEYRQALKQAESPEARQQALVSAPQALAYANRFLKVAKSQPDSPQALSALVWIATNVRHGKPLAAAAQLLTSRYIEEEGLTAITGGSARFMPSAERRVLFQQVLDNSPHKRVKQTVCLTLAQLIGTEARMAPRIKQDSERYVSIYGEKLVARLKTADVAGLQAESEELYARAVREFGDTETLFTVLQTSTGASQLTALKNLLQDHTETEQFGPRIKSFALRGGNSPAMETLLGILQAAQLGREIEGAAVLALANIKKNEADRANQFKQLPPERLKLYENAYGDDYVARLRQVDPAELLSAAASLFQRVVDEFADVNGDLVFNGRTLPRGTLGAQAAPALFEMKNLSVGKVAPEIAAEDIAGVDFKLSDYRGKVVMLDFWGHW